MELGDSTEDRSEDFINELTLLSSGACGDLPLPKEGG